MDTHAKSEAEIPQKRPGSFRGDIQGLRAIAVLVVVIFHLGPSRLPGGYIGVDMFFVISGFLIIGHIWRDLNNGTFKLLKFYSKRVMRLFPAFLVTLIGTSIIAYFALLPSETTAYSKSVISSLFYSSNFFFYSQADYWNSTLHLSPLLHTWSLAVEEQFYFIFPLILVFIFRKKPKMIVGGLILVGVISLILSESLLHVDKSASFYFSPSRFWQFVAGGILSVKFKTIDISKTVSNIMSVVGMLIITYCLFGFNAITPFPGLYALLPTLATVLLLSANNTSYINRALSTRIPLFFGDISYSLYLVHWPLIVFYKLMIATNPSLLEKLYIFLASIALGYLSWKFVEQYKWGANGKLNLRKPILTSFLISIVFSLLALFTMDGLTSRYTEKQVKYSSYLEYKMPAICSSEEIKANPEKANKGECIRHNKDKKNTIIIGDSHASHWYNPFTKLLGDEENISIVSASGCRPTIAYTGKKKCTDRMSWAFNELLQTKKFDRVILSGRWVKGDLASLIDTVKFLSKHTQEVVVLGPIIEYEMSLPRLLAVSNSEEIAAQNKYGAIKKVDKSYAEGLSKTSAKYVSILDIICPSKETCLTRTEGDIPIQYDYGHMTHLGGFTVLKRVLDGPGITPN